MTTQTSPGRFAAVMATGIMSVALALAGSAAISRVMLWLAGAGFVFLLAGACLRALAAPADAWADVSRPDRAFTTFAFVAACVVLGNGLTFAQQPGPAAGLAVVGWISWLSLTILIGARLEGRGRYRPALADVNGTWYLFAVATQSLAIAAVLLAGNGLLPARQAAYLGLAAWGAGLVLYLATTGLVLARLHRFGPPSPGKRGPYWIAMGAAAICVLAVAQILRLPGSAVTGSTVPGDIGIAVWAVATIAYLVLLGFTAAWWRPQPRYRPDAWVVLFPLGMYAAASIRFGDVAHISVIRWFGWVEAWPALAAWILTFIAMVMSKVPREWVVRQVTRAKRRTRRRRQPTMVAAAGPGPMKRYKFQAIVSPLPSAGGTLPASQPPLHAVIRADNHHGPSGGMYTGLVLSWESSPVIGAGNAIAVVVAYGPDPAACLPIGGTFALWRGTDLAIGTVTRKLFI